MRILCISFTFLLGSSCLQHLFEYLVNRKGEKRLCQITFMTTAHKPTRNAAKGSDAQGYRKIDGYHSQQYSSKDISGHTKLKYRYVPLTGF